MVSQACNNLKMAVANSGMHNTLLRGLQGI